MLASDEASPVVIVNSTGRSPFLLIADHAGNAVPARLDGLGLAATDLDRHIGWDIGIGDVGERLSVALDAVFIRQTYSRLVVDCNRGEEKSDAIPETSDGTPIPGNRGLDATERAERFAAIHAAYQAAIAAELARRDAAGIETILIALHSFTPAMNGVARPWHVGILHDRGDTRFAGAMLDGLAREPELVVGDNEPYRMDLIDHTIPRHAYPAMRPYAEIEIRQDLIDTPCGAEHWADRLGHILPRAADRSGFTR